MRPDPFSEHRDARPRSMRLAVVTETWPPEVNGVASTVARVVFGLQARGHDLQLVRPRQARVDDAGDTASVATVLTAGLPIPRYPGLRFGLPARRQLAALWSRHRPDVVHLATEGPLGWSALQAARRLRIPVTSDFRTNFHAYSDHYGIGWLHRPIAAYLRTFHNRARLTMVPTESLRRELEAIGFQRLHVVARGVDTERFDPARRDDALRARWGARGPDDLVVACVGRLAAEKNLDTVVSAYGAIRAAVPGARLLLVGDGPMRPALQSACPGAVFAGERRGEDLAAHYASADLFLFPSLTETFGNVTLEAMASGLPTLAYDRAAAAQVIRDGDNGRTVPVGDRGAFEAVSVALAADPALRRRLGARARASVASLGWEQIVARVEALMGAAATESDPFTDDPAASSAVDAGRAAPTGPG